MKTSKPSEQNVEAVKEDLDGKREDLVRFVGEYIAEEGLVACTFRSLAKRGGTSTRPFTHAFGTRAAMLSEVADYAWDQLALGSTAEHPGQDSLQKFKALCERAVPLLGRDENWMRVYASMVFHAKEEPLLAKALGEADRQGAPMYLEMIRSAQADGLIGRGHDPEDLLAAVWALCDGLVLAAFSHPDYFTKQRIRRVWDQAFDALVA